MMNSPSCALIFDVVQSRKINDWKDTVTQINQAIKTVNKKYRQSLKIKFSPTVGDEFQGVLLSPERAYDIFREFHFGLSCELYCGAGVGEIETPLQKSIEMRGTAFYNAREALEKCKKEKKRFSIVYDNEEKERQELTNTIADLICAVEDSATPRQKEIFAYYRSNRKLTLEDIGNQFSITKQAVSQALNAISYEQVLQGEKEISRLLSNEFIIQERSDYIPK